MRNPVSSVLLDSCPHRNDNHQLTCDRARRNLQKKRCLIKFFIFLHIFLDKIAIINIIERHRTNLGEVKREIPVKVYYSEAECGEISRIKSVIVYRQNGFTPLQAKISNRANE